MKPTKPTQPTGARLARAALQSRCAHCHAPLTKRNTAPHGPHCKTCRFITARAMRAFTQYARAHHEHANIIDAWQARKNLYDIDLATLGKTWGPR